MEITIPQNEYLNLVLVMLQKQSIVMCGLSPDQACLASNLDH